MERFNFPVQRGYTVEHAPEKYEVKFGDGYVMRAPKGLNSDLRKMNVSVIVKTVEQVKALKDFLSRHKGVTPFIFRDSQGDDIIVICSRWSYQRHYLHTTFSLSLEETL
ncbi:Phage-related protein [Pasteurella testudinis DSM 23072]|uniref:Phage-related protein n=1 Tax=Pasteurella testudinis DSM 23072 TaxID=1122938 RepID=A0A1W1V1Z1_9PAST|nr:phage tail protein [Pasteurella testudinis]SMB87342.1 Phage-related protein [Pasteurella testudinis DSM 23072]SUB51642.1 Gifsy-1 prophage VmtM [Pasteurella testudinis]